LKSIFTPVDIAKCKKGTDFQKIAMSQLCGVFQKTSRKTQHSQLCRVFWPSFNNMIFVKSFAPSVSGKIDVNKFLKE
jgi:hypothetical protein